MFRGPRLKSAPFAPFSRSFLPESVMRKAGFVKSVDCPYERNTATKTTHNEFFNVMIDSMFGAPSPKVLRLDPLRERYVISTSEKGRGSFLNFSDIKNVTLDPNMAVRVIITPNGNGRISSFTMETPEVAASFVQRLETMVQAKQISDKK